LLPEAGEQRLPIIDLYPLSATNIFAEKGWKAEWKYNRKGLIKNVATGVVVATILVFLFRYMNKRSAKAF
jgi:hypothetical protein